MSSSHRASPAAAIQSSSAGAVSPTASRHAPSSSLSFVSPAALAPPVASLPTGQKVYELDVSQFIDWDASAAFLGAPDSSAAAAIDTSDKKFECFCNFLDGFSDAQTLDPADQRLLSYRVLGAPGQSIMCHALLAADGFALGRLVNFGKDQEAIGQSRYAVYEVMVNCRYCSFS